MCHGLASGTQHALALHAGRYTQADAAKQLFNAAARGGQLRSLLVEHESLTGKQHQQQSYDALTTMLGQLSSLTEVELSGVPQCHLAHVMAACVGSPLKSLRVSALASDDKGPPLQAMAAEIVDALRDQPLLQELAIDIQRQDCHTLGWLRVASTMPALTRLRVGGAVLERGAGAVLGSMLAACGPRLEHLTLSGTQLAAPELGLVLNELHNCIALEKLELLDAGDSAGCPVLSDALEELPQKLRTLRLVGLAVVGRQLDVAVGALDSAAADCSLDLSSNRLRGAGMRQLGAALAAHAGTLALVARNNMLDASSVAALCKEVGNSGVLASLDLSDNALGVSGAAALVEWAAGNTNTVSLLLRNTELGESGAEAIASCCNRPTSVGTLRLDLSGNRIGARGCAAAGASEASVLVLEACAITDNEAAELIDSLAARQGVLLEQLDLSCNPIGATTVKRLIVLVQDMKAAGNVAPKFILHDTRCSDLQIEQLMIETKD